MPYPIHQQILSAFPCFCLAAGLSKPAHACVTAVPSCCLPCLCLLVFPDHWSAGVSLLVSLFYFGLSLTATTVIFFSHISKTRPSCLDTPTVASLAQRPVVSVVFLFPYALSSSHTDLYSDTKGLCACPLVSRTFFVKISIGLLPTLGLCSNVSLSYLHLSVPFMVYFLS